MKRFFVGAVMAVIMVASVSQVGAAVCSKSGGSHCQFNTGCYEMSSEYSSTPDCAAGSCTCEQVIANCEKSGAIYSGVPASALNEGNGYGTGVSCKDVGGSLIAGAIQDDVCGYDCDWGSGGCWGIVTDKAGKGEAGVVATCTEAIANCDQDGARYSSNDGTCTGSKLGGSESCNAYCRWIDNGVTECVEVKPDPTGLYGAPTPDCAAALLNCQTNGEKFDTKAACESAPIAGVYCDYGAASEYGAGGCYWKPGWTTADCEGDYGHVVTACNNSVKLLGTPNSKLSGLRVSYARGNVSVNWSANSKILSGSVNLINAKGVVISSALIKANSSKITAKLGTKGVPAGMYFVRVNARDVSGKKITMQTPISIVK